MYKPLTLCVSTGMFLKDLTFTEDGNPKIMDELLNFKRMVLIYDNVALVMKYQRWTFPVCSSTSRY